MWWKVYFWVLLTLFIVSLFSYLQYAPLKFWDLESMGEGALVSLGAYSFTYRKRFFSEKFWKAAFWYLGIVWGLQVIDVYFLNMEIEKSIPALQTSSQLSSEGILFSVLLGLPALYAIYQLGYAKSKKK